VAHGVDGRKLGRKQGHRLALYGNLIVSVLRYEETPEEEFPPAGMGSEEE